MSAQPTDMSNAIARTNEASLDRIRAHPFIRDAHAGSLSKDQAIRWIFCAGRESRSFPAIIENILARTTNEKVREILNENLDDEYGNGNPEQAHFKHYLHLLDKLSICRENFEQYNEEAGINLALSLAYNISSQPNQGIALGYMLVNEGMTPITYEAARGALGKHFSGLPTVFFDMHIAVDEKHVEDLYRAIDAMPAEASEDILFGISIGERGMAVLLDEAYGIFDYVKETMADGKAA